MTGSGTDAIFIANLGRYNEGSLVGEWLRLPYEPGDLRSWLVENAGVDAFHEEVAIFDTDFCGALGDIGFECGEYTPIDGVNLLASLAGGLGSGGRAAVRAAADNLNVREPVEYCNLVMQADDIPYYRLDGEPRGAMSDGKRLALTLLEGGDALSRLSDEALLAHFDYEAFGRRLDDEGFILGEAGFIYSGCEEIDVSRYDAEDVEDEELSRTTVHLIDDEGSATILECYGLSSERVAEAGPALRKTVASICLDLTPSEDEALTLYCKNMMSPLDGVLELANVAMEVDAIPYSPYRSDRGTVHERVAVAFEMDCGLLRSDLVDFFDFESYGRKRAVDVEFTADGTGYLDLCQDFPDLDRFSHGDLVAMARQAESACRSVLECYPAVSHAGRGEPSAPVSDPVSLGGAR